MEYRKKENKQRSEKVKLIVIMSENGSGGGAIGKKLVNDEYTCEP